MVAEFVEVESGKRNDRAELTKAIRASSLYDARLSIAKLDQSSRDAHLLLGLEKAGVDLVAADMATTNRLTVGIMAMVAEEERRMFSARTKAALQAAKARETVLGGRRGGTVDDAARAASVVVRNAAATARAADVLLTSADLRAAGVITLAALAENLTARSTLTARVSAACSPTQVGRVLKRVVA